MCKLPNQTASPQGLAGECNVVQGPLDCKGRRTCRLLLLFPVGTSVQTEHTDLEVLCVAKLVRAELWHFLLWAHGWGPLRRARQLSDIQLRLDCRSVSASPSAQHSARFNTGFRRFLLALHGDRSIVAARSGAQQNMPLCHNKQTRLEAC